MSIIDNENDNTNNNNKDYYHMQNETRTCGDGCCFYDETYLEKNNIRYKEIYEDNGDEYERDKVFYGIEDVVEFILETDFNIKIAKYMTDWGEADTFKNTEADYIIIDGYDSKGFDDYFYIIKRKDYLDNLELKGINKENIISDFKKRKEPDDSYNDLFKYITGNELSSGYNHTDNEINFDDDFDDD